jgi:VIT1/CCC1 family predicted Fe2+/Mn2+ transporter
MITYIDNKPGSKKTYTLTSESLVIAATKWLGGSYRFEFALNKVKPEPDEHLVKDDTRRALIGLPGFCIFLVGAIFGTAIYQVTPIGFYSVISIGLAAMFVGFVLARRNRVLVFKSLVETPLFDVTDRGRHKEFEAFTNELKERIRAATDP